MSTTISSPAGFFWSDTVTPESAADLASVLEGLEVSGAAAEAAAMAASTSATAASTAASDAAAAASSAVATVTTAVTNATTTIDAAVTSATTTLSAAAATATTAASDASASASTASSSATTAASAATTAGTSATAAASSATTAATSATAASTSATNAAASATSAAASATAAVNRVNKAGDTMTGPLVVPTIASPSASTALVIKDGPAGTNMLTIGGTSNDIQPQTNIKLPGGTWGSGTLVNNFAPIFQNSTFAGTNTGGSVAFSAFLQQTEQTDTGDTQAWGFIEHLITNGAGATGTRTAGQFNLDIVTTGNTNRQEHVGLGSKCNLMTSEGGLSSAFGLNPVAHVGPGVTALTCVGGEVNTWIEATATVTDKLGWAIVDVAGSIKATGDNIGLTINNQYVPTSTLGFTTGIEFGRFGGHFPVTTTGTLIYGQGNQGAAWTVAKGIDFTLGTATSYWLKFGSLTFLDGSGNMNATTVKSNGGVSAFGATPPASKPTITGSRGSATATVLASLLTALAAAGFITDSTTS